MHAVTRMTKTALGLISRCNNWPEYYLDYLGYHKHNWVIDLKDIKLELRPSSVDKWIVAENLILDAYEFNHLKKLGIEQIFDIGANIGAFSIPAATHLSVNEIISFEPDPDNFKLLTSNITRNNLSAIVELHNSAVSLSDASSIRLYKGNDFGSNSTFHTSGSFLDVANTNLYSLLPRIKQNALLKMDIEGGELEIFTTSNLEFLRKFKFIVLEFHHFLETHDKDKFEKFLTDSGFKYKSDDIIYLISK